MEKLTIWIQFEITRPVAAIKSLRFAFLLPKLLIAVVQYTRGVDIIIERGNCFSNPQNNAIQANSQALHCWSRNQTEGLGTMFEVTTSTDAPRFRVINSFLYLLILCQWLLYKLNVSYHFIYYRCSLASVLQRTPATKAKPKLAMVLCFWQGIVRCVQDGYDQINPINTLLDLYRNTPGTPVTNMD